MVLGVAGTYGLEHVLVDGRGLGLGAVVALKLGLWGLLVAPLWWLLTPTERGDLGAWVARRMGR